MSTAMKTLLAAVVVAVAVAAILLVVFPNAAGTPYPAIAVFLTPLLWLLFWLIGRRRERERNARG